MDSLHTSRIYSVCKREDIANIYKQCDPNAITTTRKILQSPQNHPNKNFIRKSSTDTVQIRKQDSKIVNSIKPLQLEEETFAKSAHLTNQEIKMRTMITVQDRFRLRVPEPKNSIEQVCRECNFYYLHEPHRRKPLIVLDLESLKLTNPENDPPSHPTMLHLLEYLYCRFDIAVWSTLKMCDLIPKLETYGFFQKNNKFKINFVLDRTAMTSIYVPSLGIYRAVKDLEVIWNIYPQYNEQNCIMINYHLKKIIYESYGVSLIKCKQDKYVDEVTMTVLIEFLIETIGSRQLFAKLSTPIWKQYED